MAELEDEDYGLIEIGEKSGRWTNLEHKLFLYGLKLYEKHWKSIAEMIKTRTVVQVRTHAQKYFAKQKKRLQLDPSDGGASSSSSSGSGSYYSHSSSNSLYSSNNNSSDDGDAVGTRKPNSKKARRGSGSLPNVATGLALAVQGRYSRSSSFASTTATDSAANTPRIRKRNSHFFDEEDIAKEEAAAAAAASGASSSAAASSALAGGVMSTPRRSSARSAYTPPGTVLAAAAPSSTVDPIDLAFDADFRADIIASDLHVDGLGSSDVSQLLAPADATTEWLRVTDDETTVDTYSPVSPASSSDAEHEYNTFSIMYAFPYGAAATTENMAIPSDPMFDTFMADI